MRPILDLRVANRPRGVKLKSHVAVAHFSLLLISRVHTMFPCFAAIIECRQKNQFFINKIIEIPNIYMGI